MQTELTFTFTMLFALASSAMAQHEGHQVCESHGEQHSGENVKIKDNAGGQIWTCSMHPQIHLPKSGKCPICHMDLIPVKTEPPESSPEEDASSSLTISEKASKLMEIATSPVERKWITRSVRLVGKIDYDETRVKRITAWVAGRIERMFVDYTGIEVREADHMVSLYSPDLVSAQEELIQSSRFLKHIKGGSRIVQRSSRRSLKAARDKLKLLGLTAEQVLQIEKSGKTKNNITIYAPMGGTVVQKYVNEGMYVQTGSRIYTIADLHHLWLNLDAYESDLLWIKYGQEVEFSAAALPGKTFQGVVSFIHPVLDEKTRTVKVRVNVNNHSKRLKPGMFVTANIKSQIDRDGNALSVSYEGKYICPMHPEIVMDSKGSCSVCGMDLVQAETLSFVDNNDNNKRRPPLIIPASAPLITGKRSVVYVKDPNKHHYRGREVLLGPKAGDYYLIKSGLKEGELVVTNGAFKLDADLQIKGQKSMMGVEAHDPHH